MEEESTPRLLARVGADLIPLHLFRRTTGSRSPASSWPSLGSGNSAVSEEPVSQLVATDAWSASTEDSSSFAVPIKNAPFSSLRLELREGPELFAAMAMRLGLCEPGAPICLASPDAILGVLKSLASSILHGYRVLPYHNWHHALDTTHFISTALERIVTLSSRPHLSLTDKLAALVAMLGHDIDHRGHSNSFENNSLSELSLLYNTDSVLEHHHAATLMHIIKKDVSASQQRPQVSSNSSSMLPVRSAHANILGLNLTAFTQFRRVAVSLILGTDMALHAGLVETMQSRGSSFSSVELLTVLVHASDISAPLHPEFDVAYEWSERCNAEFHAQAECEAAMSLPSAPFMQSLGTPALRAHQQLVFLDAVILPLWQAIIDLLPELGDLFEPFSAHRKKYELIAEGASGVSAIPHPYSSTRPVIEWSSPSRLEI